MVLEMELNLNCLFTQERLWISALDWWNGFVMLKTLHNYSSRDAICSWGKLYANLNCNLQYNEQTYDIPSSVVFSIS